MSLIHSPTEGIDLHLLEMFLLLSEIGVSTRALTVESTSTMTSCEVKSPNEMKR